jgi:hypothetical protein
MRRRSGKGVGRWLFLCFPYGLFLMWRRGCRWHPAVKGLITAAFVCAVCAVMLIPAPRQHQGTRITLVGYEPEAEVFGPEQPAGYDAAAYLPGSEDNDLFAERVEDDTIYVYASANEGSTYYHTSICEFAYASSRRMTLYEAYVLGYTTPCQKCKPPVYGASEAQ